MRARKQFFNAYGIKLTKNSYTEIFVLLLCLDVVLATSALGFISIPPISLTTLSIPVLVAAMYFGPVEGTAVSLVFAIASMWQASLTSVEEGDVIFSPSLSGKPGASIVMAVLTRVLFALLAGYLYRWFFSKKRNRRGPGIALIAVVATATHALLVYVCMVAFFSADEVETSAQFGYELVMNNIILYGITVLVVLACDALIRRKSVTHFFEIISADNIEVSRAQKRTSAILTVTVMLACVLIFFHFMSRIVGFFTRQTGGLGSNITSWAYSLLSQFAFGFAATFGVVFMFFRWMEEYLSTLSTAARESEHIRDEIVQNNARFFALEDDFESLYDVELDSGKYTSYVKGDFYQNNVIDKLVAPNDYFEDLRANIEATIYPDDREELYKALTRESIRRNLSEMDHFDYFYRVSTMGGPNWFRLRIVYKDKDKKSVVIGVFNAEGDIEAKQISKQNAQLVAQQEELEKARIAAEAANKAKTEFLFNMSHDIRTPMNAITGFTNIAIKHIDDREKVLDSLDKSQKACGMLLSLINSVLEVSRIESGNATLEEQYGDVYYSFVNIENTMRDLAETKDITLTFEFGNIRDRYVLADFGRCVRVFVNVISNAIKYTHEGGFVKVRCEQVGEAENGIATYSYTVEDNGIGMSEEFQEHVFEQFTREQNSTVSGVQGTGLGMAVTKSFVELMGGSISVKSKQGEGTVFTIILPFVLQEGAEFTDPATGDIISSSYSIDYSEHISLSGRKVLLVEDNELNREIAVDMLEEQGMDIEDADDGTTAVEMMREKGPDYYDFILMDIQMPIMNGYEATRQIREMYPDKHIPIIALSANAFVEDKNASIEAGMDAHVSKPIRVSELYGAMAKFI